MLAVTPESLARARAVPCLEAGSRTASRPLPGIPGLPRRRGNQGGDGSLLREPTPGDDRGGCSVMEVRRDLGSGQVREARSGHEQSIRTPWRVS